MGLNPIETSQSFLCNCFSCFITARIMFTSKSRSLPTQNHSVVSEINLEMCECQCLIKSLWDQLQQPSQFWRMIEGDFDGIAEVTDKGEKH